MVGIYGYQPIDESNRNVQNIKSQGAPRWCKIARAIDIGLINKHHQRSYIDGIQPFSWLPFFISFSDVFFHRASYEHLDSLTICLIPSGRSFLSMDIPRCEIESAIQPRRNGEKETEAESRQPRRKGRREGSFLLLSVVVPLLYSLSTWSLHSALIRTDNGPAFLGWMSLYP